MKKSVLMMAGLAATVLGAPAAYASVTCEPGSCIDNTTNALTTAATFKVTPAVAATNPNYVGNISATIGNSGIAAGTFTDTFEFALAVAGIGGGSVTTNASFIGAADDIDFTSVLVNGVAGSVSKVGALTEIAFKEAVNLAAGPNTIQISGLARGNGSYGGSISFTPSVPETATWGMMILGFVGMGAAMRYRRKSTNVAFA